MSTVSLFPDNFFANNLFPDNFFLEFDTGTPGKTDLKYKVTAEFDSHKYTASFDTHNYTAVFDQ